MNLARIFYFRINKFKEAQKKDVFLEEKERFTLIATKIEKKGEHYFAC